MSPGRYQYPPDGVADEWLNLIMETFCHSLHTLWLTDRLYRSVLNTQAFKIKER